MYYNNIYKLFWNNIFQDMICYDCFNSDIFYLVNFLRTEIIFVLVNLKSLFWLEELHVNTVSVM